MRHRTQFPVFELRGAYLALALGASLGTLLSAASALVAGSLVSDVASGELDAAAAAPVLLAYLALSLSAQLATFALAGWLPERANLRREVDSSARAIELVLAMPQRAFARHDAGHYLNLVNLASFAHGAIVVAMSAYVPGAVLSLAVLLAMAALEDPALAVVLAACAPAYVIIVWAPSHVANRLQTQMMPPREAWLDEGRRVVEERRAAVAAGAEGFYEHRYQERTEKYRRFRRGYLLADTLSNELPYASGLLVQALAVVVCALVAGGAGAGTLVVAWQLAGLLALPMSYLCQAQSIYAANRVNIDLLRALEREAAEPSGFERLRRTSHGASSGKRDRAASAAAPTTLSPVTEGACHA
ncbi:ABC transporter transmembrane domain-containing protein [Olsenella profusa]|uniref:ABC transmembrane type-1 domain-containing protein n=1 Tax=Olsenella profusa TaxID=138595 RepID=A0ABS2F1A5_9ACTN|nr:ABC transporter transmembrane domain-containing protein [Olsenella profusa]MBM6774759.1 hypothetical protein [Olsenella profusa]